MRWPVDTEPYFSFDPRLPRAFWEKVTFEKNGCWIWSAAATGGYGRFGVSKRAHVFAFEQLRCAVPAGLELDHLCRTPACVNPDHLESVTHAENVHRGLGGKHNLAKTHCPRGHAYSTENTKMSADGRRRFCRACHRADDARRRGRAQ